MNEHLKQAMNFAASVSGHDAYDALFRPKTAPNAEQKVPNSQETTTIPMSPTSLVADGKTPEASTEAMRKSDSLKPLV